MSLRCALLNVQGLSTKRSNKLLSKEVIEIFNNNDIVLFTETWSNEFSEFNVNGFEQDIQNFSGSIQMEHTKKNSELLMITN